MVDVIIIGAGMAGLSAARMLKRMNVSFVVLEAQDEAGGRAVTRMFPSGIAADMGAHWLHGENNPVRELLTHYGISYHKDKGDALFVHQNGRKRRVDSNWLEKAVDQKKAERIKKGLEPDCKISELAVSEKAREELLDFGRMWNGIDPPLQPSALEFLTDESTPGGLQIEGGMKALIGAMVREVGEKNIIFNAVVAKIVRTPRGIEVLTRDKSYEARKAIFTGSHGVLSSGRIAFDPPLGKELKQHLAGMVMGKMNRIVIELESGFFKERGVVVDTGYELLDVQPPHFCHVHSAGYPLINLFVSGDQAQKVEGFTAEQAVAYVMKIMHSIKELQGFEKHVVSEPFVSAWIGNPYVRGAYSALLPGFRRSGPWMEGDICFCGDMFDEQYPSALAGAYRSGESAATELVKALSLQAA